jgi:hypothetical protein
VWQPCHGHPAPHIRPTSRGHYLACDVWVRTHRERFVHVEAPGCEVAEEHCVLCPVREVLRQALACQATLQLTQTALLLRVGQLVRLTHGAREWVFAEPKRLLVP